LSRNDKGQRKVLASLYHDFERSIRADVRKPSVNRAAPCYAYHASVGFGAPFPSVVDAFERLGALDGWLIVLSDGSAGIYRPEDRWDATIEVVEIER